ncbi:MAG: hypothetical protein OXI96_01865 [Acidimicrobiaceae bacterium]|nr:hypothetical protein [Acidimicrobiaceae bacterium]
MLSLLIEGGRSVNKSYRRLNLPQPSRVINSLYHSEVGRTHPTFKLECWFYRCGTVLESNQTSPMGVSFNYRQSGSKTNPQQTNPQQTNPQQTNPRLR